MSKIRSSALAASLTGLLLAGLLVPVTAEAGQGGGRNYFKNCTAPVDDTTEAQWDPPMEPAEVVATTSLTTAGAVDVEWSIPSSTTKIRCFIIQWRATDKSETGFIGSVRLGAGLSEGDRQRYTVTGLTPNTSYRIKVAALSGFLGSWAKANITPDGPSTPVTVYAAPGAPEFTATVQGRVASMWWTEPTDLGGAEALAGYTVEMKQGTKPWAKVCGSDTGFIPLADESSPCTKGNLVWGTDYQFRVSATSDIADGQGLRSLWSTSEVFTPSTTPEAPAEPDLEIDGRKVIVTWDAPDERGAEIKKYEVIWTVKGTTTQDRAESGRTTFTTPSLSPGKVYVITVRAKNSRGWGDLSDPAEVPIVDVPGPVQNLAGQADDRSVALTWRVPLDKGDTRNGSLTGYQIEASTDKGATWDVIKDSVKGTSFTATRLRNGESYQFQVSAILTYELTGKGGRKTTYELIGEPALIKGITPFTKSTEPRNIATRLGDRSITITWEQPRDLGGTALKKWVIEQTENGGQSWTRISAPGRTATSLTVSGLVIGRSYQFRIAAVTEGDGTELAGAAARSTEVKADGVPGKPFLLANSNVPKKITASWTRPAGGTATAITLRVRPVGVTTWSTYPLPGTATAWASGAAYTSTKSYEIQVQMTNSFGSGDWSANVTVRVK